MKAAPFDYVRAESVEHAATLLRDGEGDARILAGGQSLLALMAFRQARPRMLIDVNEVPGLDHHSLKEDGSDVTIGATCRQEVLERWLPRDRKWAAVPSAVRLAGNYVTRLRGTVGGSIAHADPAAELPLVFLLLDGELTARSASGERTISGTDFFVGPHETALAHDEVLTAIRLMAPPDGAVTAFHELTERVAVASAAVGLAVGESGCSWCRIALGGVGPTPIRAEEAERILLESGAEPPALEKAAAAAAAACTPVSDSHGPASFRRAVVEALVRRGLNEATSGLTPA